MPTTHSVSGAPHREATPRSWRARHHVHHDHGYAPRRLEPPGGDGHAPSGRRRRHLTSAGQKAALGRRRRRPAGRPAPSADPRRARAHRHRPEPGGAAADPPFDRPPDGRRGDGVCIRARSAVSARPSTRGYFYEASVVPQPFVPEESRADRRPRCASWRPGFGLRAPDVGPPGRDRLLYQARRAAERRSIEEKTAGEPTVSVYTIKDRDTFVDLCRPARAVDVAAQGVQADCRRRTPIGKATPRTSRCSGSTARRSCRRRSSTRT